MSAASRALLALPVLAVYLAGCGGGSSSGSGGGAPASGLVADVGKVGVDDSGKQVVATADLKTGGKPGEHLELKWGLVDAVAGRESEEEKVAAKVTTTPKVEKRTVTIRFPRPTIPTTYL